MAQLYLSCLETMMKCKKIEVDKPFLFQICVCFLSILLELIGKFMVLKKIFRQILVN